MTIFAWNNLETERKLLRTLAKRIAQAEMHLNEEGIDEGLVATAFVDAVTRGNVQNSSEYLTEYATANREIRLLINRLCKTYNLAVGMIQLEYMPILNPNPETYTFYKTKMDNEFKYNKRMNKKCAVAH